MDYDVIVIGGGAAGMLAAYGAATQGSKTILLEKNEKLGKKLYLTGKGRCNVTNYGDKDNFFRNLVTNPKFLYSAWDVFNNRDLIALLNSSGVPTKVEQGGRVFPASDKSSDIIRALTRLLEQKKVIIKYSTPVQQILTAYNRVTGVLLKDGIQIKAPRIILATGGLAYPQTGSTGDGYTFAKALGHTIIQPRPALTPLVVKESWVKELQGLTLKNVSVKVWVKNKKQKEQFGELLFTHFGVSGPVILTLNSLIKDFSEERTLFIDLKPALTYEQLDARLQRVFIKFSGKQLKNSLDDLLPQRMIAIVLRLSTVDIHKQVDQINKTERASLINVLKNIPLTVIGPRSYEEAIVTGGGINVKEITPSTMASKICSGLYLAGEVIDVDGLTGGYNLQIAFSTGYLSGISAAKNQG